jgi:hypothetical protein
MKVLDYNIYSPHPSEVRAKNVVETIKKRSPKLVRLDSVNKVFLDGITGQITNECEVLYGDFIEIPPGEHRISIVLNGKHMWNSYLIKDMEFQYIYY